MKNTFSLIAGPAIVGLLLAGGPSIEQADATDGQAAEIFTVEDPWIKATEESLDETSDDTMTGAFVHLTNVSGEDQTVVGTKCEIAEVVELHGVIDDGGASVRQEKPGGLPAPAEESDELNPGEDRIMLRQLTDEISPGDPVEITLELENGESQTIEFIAKEYVGAQENYGDLDDAEHDH